VVKLKKKVLALSIILCLLSLLLLKEYKISVKAIPNIIYVPDDYAKIQWAIDNATEGGTIFVRSGIYYENIVINKSITLMGEDRNSTIIDGSEAESVIFIKNVCNVIVKEFTLRRSGLSSYNNSGVVIERSNGIIISNNTILTNLNGISIFSSYNIIIHTNNISKNFYDGISLYYSTNNTIYSNAVSSNSGGISLYWSSSNVISANAILNNPSGGINLLFSSHNIICRNNFNNIVQAWSGASTNFWSYEDEGNYWSDYSGEDLNGDGIGDVPYVIDDTNNDSRPLMGMFHAFDITYKGETYHVDIISNSTLSDFNFQLGGETGNKLVHFKLGGANDSVGFCRIMIPTRFMSYPFILLLDDEEIHPTFLHISNDTHAYLYFTYLHKNQTVTIISSELYSELLSLYNDLNEAYCNLLNNYTLLLSNHTQLQRSFEELQGGYDDLNVTYYGLLSNYTQLQEHYQELNASYQDHLRSYSENLSKVQNLTYVIAAITAILIIVTTYLSKRAHSGGGMQKIKKFEEEQ
jgi:parallel beta-helix repeat protein